MQPSNMPYTVAPTTPYTCLPLSLPPLGPPSFLVPLPHSSHCGPLARALSLSLTCTFASLGRLPSLAPSMKVLAHHYNLTSIPHLLYPIMILLVTLYLCFFFRSSIGSTESFITKVLLFSSFLIQIQSSPAHFSTTILNF